MPSFLPSRFVVGVWTSGVVEVVCFVVFIGGLGGVSVRAVGPQALSKLFECGIDYSLRFLFDIHFCLHYFSFITVFTSGYWTIFVIFSPPCSLWFKLSGPAFFSCLRVLGELTFVLGGIFILFEYSSPF